LISLQLKGFLTMTDFFRNTSIFFIIFLVLILQSCSPKQELSAKVVPAGIIQPDSMAVILADLQVAESMLHQMERNDQFTDSLVHPVFEKVFLKHKITSDELKKSTAYYEQHLDIYEEIYTKVITQLTQIQTEIGDPK
jgi:hypothetical protein